MALPADFSKIFGSTATGGLTPIGDVNYAKGWEFVGGNPPTKNDFSYLQNLSDLKSQWLYSNKLQRTDPFGDIKADGEVAVSTALTNLGLGASAFGLKNSIIFDSAGVTSWEVPEELKMGRKCRVTVVGGGGSGGRNEAGGGGGGGGIAEGMLDLTGVDNVLITVGAGGIAPAAGTTVAVGVPGGTSSFGTYMSATGGGGGQTPSSGEGGVGIGGLKNSSLGPGNPGSSWTSSSYVTGSGGGPGGNGLNVATSKDGFDAIGPGGGGSGAGRIGTTTASRAGSGADGYVLVEW